MSAAFLALLHTLLAAVGGAALYAVAHKAAIAKTAEDTITAVEDAVNRRVDRIVPDLKAIVEDAAAFKAAAK